MKTDVVEIFQTIRASIQPYAALGFDVKENSETSYQLFTENKLKEPNENTVFFAGISINDTIVTFCLFPKDSTDFSKILSQFEIINGCYNINKLEESKLAELETALSEGYKVYKEKGWV